MECPICKSKMIWQSDTDLEELGYEESGISTFYLCSNERCESEFSHVQKEESVEVD